MVPIMPHVTGQDVACAELVRKLAHRLRIEPAHTFTEGTRNRERIGHAERAVSTQSVTQIGRHECPFYAIKSKALDL